MPVFTSSTLPAWTATCLDACWETSGVTNASAKAHIEIAAGRNFFIELDPFVNLKAYSNLSPRRRPSMPQTRLASAA